MLTWFMDTDPIASPPRNPFYEQGRKKIETIDAQGEQKVLDEMAAWLDDVYAGKRSVTSVTFDAGRDWTGTPLQVIYDALGDVQLSAFWAGLALIKAAIMHPDA